VGIKRLGPNRYQVRINRIDPKTGRKVNRKALVEGTREEAESVLANLRGEVLSTAARPQRMQLAPYAVAWLERRSEALKPSTHRRYSYALLKILPALGEYYLDSISPGIVQTYIHTRTKTAQGHTVLNELRVLRTIAKDAHSEGRTERVFTDRVKAPSVRRYTIDNPNLLSAAQAQAVIQNLDKRWQGMVLLMITTGLRWGEASALQWEDIQGEIAVIRHGNDRGELIAVKTRSSYRAVPVLPEVLSLRRAKGPVFPSRTGGIYASSAPLLRALKAATKAAGIEHKVTVHGLRRTFNNSARRKTSREVLMEMTGHDTHEMVEHYSVVDHSEKVAASRAVLTEILTSVPEASRDEEVN
jgi:integrase